VLRTPKRLVQPHRIFALEHLAREQPLARLAEAVSRVSGGIGGRVSGPRQQGQGISTQIVISGPVELEPNSAHRSGIRAAATKRTVILAAVLLGAAAIRTTLILKSGRVDPREVACVERGGSWAQKTQSCFGGSTADQLAIACVSSGGNWVALPPPGSCQRSQSATARPLSQAETAKAALEAAGYPEFTTVADTAITNIGVGACVTAASLARDPLNPTPYLEALGKTTARALNAAKFGSRMYSGVDGMAIVAVLLYVYCPNTP